MLQTGDPLIQFRKDNPRASKSDISKTTRPTHRRAKQSGVELMVGFEPTTC